MTTATGIYAAAFRQGIKPEPRLSLSEWMEREFVLSSESSAVSGKIHLYPFQAGMADAITDPEVERVTIMKSARIGYTTMLKAAIGYHIDQAPCPVMVVQPTIADAEGFSQQEIAPMLRDTPALQGKIADPRSRDSGNTILRKNFPGGFLTIVGANSPTGFRRVTIRLLLMDELDGWPPSAGTEGDQEKLAERRTETFWNRKVVRGSTPTVKGASRIENSYLRGDQRQYFVPCPECGVFQLITWAKIKWKKDDPETAAMECEGCRAAIPHSKKRWMLERGAWRATAVQRREGNEVLPEKGHASFRIWAGYSLNANASWADLAREFLAAKKDPESLKTFVNTVLGETWDADQGEGVAGEGLYARREEYESDPLPEKVLVLTAGVDVQDDRIECEITGWGLGFESWSIDYHVLLGSPGLPDVWKQLEDVLTQSFTLPSGVELEVAAAAVDTGGHHTQAVYDWVRPRQVRRVYAIRGSSKPGLPIAGRPTQKEKITLIPIGTEAAKDWIFSRLKIEAPGPGYCHFPSRYDEEYFAQLTAERAVIKFSSGVPRRSYRQIRPRNESLDARVYSLAALRLLNPNLEKIAESLGRRAEETKKRAAPKKPAVQDPGPKVPTRQTKKRPRPSSSLRRLGGWTTKW